MKLAVFKPCHVTSRGVCREEMLHALVAHAVAVKEVRLIRDKFTGQPRGFCFMEFHSISDAAIALQLLQVLPAASYFRSSCALTHVLSLCWKQIPLSCFPDSVHPGM